MNKYIRAFEILNHELAKYMCKDIEMLKTSEFHDINLIYQTLKLVVDSEGIYNVYFYKTLNVERKIPIIQIGLYEKLNNSFAAVVSSTKAERKEVIKKFIYKYCQYDYIQFIEIIKKAQIEIEEYPEAIQDEFIEILEKTLKEIYKWYE